MHHYLFFTSDFMIDKKFLFRGASIRITGLYVKGIIINDYYSKGCISIIMTRCFVSGRYK
jgi:hypothetical protein